MAAILATALPVEIPKGTSSTLVARVRPPRLACRWVVDPATGRLVASWEIDEESQPPILHLWLVRA
jgi:hypothetical protein